MRRWPMRWKIYPSYLLVIILSVVAVGWYAESQFRRFYLDQTVAMLEARARLIDGSLGDADVLADSARVDALCKDLGRRTEARSTIIRVDGTVSGDSDHDPGTMDNHADRPEVRTALAGELGWQLRRSDTREQQMLYLADPVRRDGRLVAVVRVALSLDAFEETLRTLWKRIAVGGLVIGVLAAGLSWVVARRISRPLESLRRGAERFSRGQFSRKLRVPDSQEMAALAEAMNEMAASLDDRMRTIAEQRNELEAVFDAMTEGVLVVDRDERVVHLNRAAEAILRVQAPDARGRFIQEVARNPDLQAFLRTAISSDRPVEGDIAWHGDQDRFFQAWGTALADAAGRRRGSVIVLNEVTRLYRLERVRRDFVANVSHEMQTPITAIYGYAETLMDQDARTAEMIGKAVQAIARQAHRLGALVDDLLELSRIEKQAEAGDVPLARGSVGDVLAAAIETCRTTADERGVTICLACDGDLEANINPELLERAVVNLLDNATKYSERGKEVVLQAEAAEGEIVIQVRDRGCGIAREHLPRLFERFYRVDKARSRSLGGTGLGLAIVKHITLAHGGRVTVESTLGEGSTFTIHLPRPG